MPFRGFRGNPECYKRVYDMALDEEVLTDVGHRANWNIKR